MNKNIKERIFFTFNDTKYSLTLNIFATKIGINLQGHKCLFTDEREREYYYFVIQ